MWAYVNRTNMHLYFITCFSLQHCYGRNFTNALGIVDDAGVSCYIAEPSGRTVFMVGVYFRWRTHSLDDTLSSAIPDRMLIDSVRCLMQIKNHSFVYCVSSYYIPLAPTLWKQVKGRAPGDWHTVFPAHYCSCQSFFYDVVCQSNALNVSALSSLPCPTFDLHLTLIQTFWCNAVQTPTSSPSCDHAEKVHR